MRFLLGLTAILLTAPMIAFSGDNKLKVAHCAAMSDPITRLECFDMVSKAEGVAGGVETSVKSSGKWQVVTEKSPIDDTTNVTASLLSDNQVSNRWRNQKATLVLRCNENSTNVFVQWNDFLGGDDITVLERMDKEKARNRQWTLSTDKMSTFVNGGYISYINKLAGHKKLLLQLTPYNSNTVMAYFDLTGIEKAINPIKEACHWGAIKKASIKAPPLPRSITYNDDYERMLRERIGKNWLRPAAINDEATVSFKVKMTDNGNVLDVKKIKSSGTPVFDRSIESAIYRSAPLPVNTKTNSREVDLTFTVKP